MTNEGAPKLRIGHWGLDIGHFLLGAYTHPFVQFELFVVLLPLSFTTPLRVIRWQKFPT